MDWLLALIFAMWLFYGFDFSIGMLWGLPKIPILNQTSPQSPKISIIFAARNEEKEIASAVSTMLAQNYPDFEVIAVNDRSEDQTLQILQRFAKVPQLKIVNIEKLPSGWLGKNHALYQGYLQSEGEWLLFTDADVHFHPQALTSAAAVCAQNKLDHLIVSGRLIIKSFFEELYVNTFIQMFFRRFRPWMVKYSWSKAYIGFGAFNFVRKTIYKNVGTHQALAMQVIDDMELGKAIKLNGGRQQMLINQELLWVRWVEGLSGIFASLKKNAYAGLGFSIWQLLMVSLLIFCVDILPFILIFTATGVTFYLTLGILSMIFAVHATSQKYDRFGLVMFPFHPFGSLLVGILFWLSAIPVWRSGGIRWRDTFYSVETLKKRS